MFALGIRYLNGWAMATHPTDRTRAEWPPHPDRVFMALAAAHFETDGDKNERAALEWLERLAPPELAASKAEKRRVIPVYVPVNDTKISRPANDSASKLKKRLSKLNAVDSLDDARNAGLALLPEFRSRKQVTFPMVIPHDPCVYLIWPQATCSENHGAALASLCAKVTSIGDPSSLVQVWIEGKPPESNWVPAKDSLRSTLSLRVFGRGGESGRLTRLESHHRLEQQLGRRQGIACDAIRYHSVEPRNAESDKLPHSSFDPALLILRRVAGPRLGLESTLQLTEALRNTVMTQCSIQPPSEWISGHTADGAPSQRPHLAFIPLPDVKHMYAKGHLLGAALVVPRDIPAEEQQHMGGVLFDDEGLPRELEIRMGRIGVWKMQLDEGEDSRLALQPETWTKSPGGAKRWATVTPIVFDQHPKKPGEAEETLAAACERIGLPRPKDVILTSVSMFIGTPHARRFPLMPRKTGGHRQHTHAILTFDQPIVGPVLLGAGRFRGYGLCRPL